MKYRAVVFLLPTNTFGLPGDNAIVFPADPSGKESTVTFPSIDSTTLERTSWGTLSRYREDKDALRANSSVRGCQAGVVDNYLTLEFTVEDPLTNSPWDVARDATIALCRPLTLLTDEPIDFHIVSLQQLEGQQKHLRAARIGGTVSAYNLAELSNKVQESMEIADLRDPTLEKALTYYRHGAILRDGSTTRAWDDESPGSTQAILFKSESFLNYWKAATSIIGDRTKGDANDERGRRLGLGPDYYRTTVQPLTNLRNDFDVAHYDVQLERAKLLSPSLGPMVQVAKVLLTAYIAYLKSGGSAFSPRNP
ncbi:MAG: hypothetical protein L3K02_04555 [Thermoplasmata archaeon]|nr:hypothetical protein [Thermoplasmata archaeon]